MSEQDRPAWHGSFGQRLGMEYLKVDAGEPETGCLQRLAYYPRASASTKMDRIP